MSLYRISNFHCVLQSCSTMCVGTHRLKEAHCFAATFINIFLPPSSAPSSPVTARAVPEPECSPSPRTKKKGLFRRWGAKSKDDAAATDTIHPASTISSSLAQEVAHRAKSLPRENLLHLEKHQGQQAVDARDTNGRVSEDHDGGEDEVDAPEVPSRGYLSDEAEEDIPELPPRQYNWSDFESDADDDDDDAGESEEILQKVYDSLAKFGGPSKETEKLYDTLEQYQKAIFARKQSMLPSVGGMRAHIAHTRTQ